jgi:hypothetical protein
MMFNLENAKNCCMKFKKIVFVLTLFVLGGSLSAQELLQARLRAISLSGSIHDLELMSADGPLDFKVPSGRRSKVMEYVGSQNLVFIPKGSYIPDLPVPDALAQIQLSPKLRHPLLIFIPNNKGYRVVVIEDDLNRFPGGSVLFVNLSPYPIVLLMGEDASDRIQLKPAEMKVREFDRDNVNVRVRGASLVDQEVKKGMDTRIFPLPKFRDICFIYPERKQEAGSVKMRTLREHVLTAERAYVRAKQ